MFPNTSSRNQFFTILLEKLLLYGKPHKFMACFHEDWSKSFVVEYDIVLLFGQDRTEDNNCYEMSSVSTRILLVSILG